jgi:hypothetical protein
MWGEGTGSSLGRTWPYILRISLGRGGLPRTPLKGWENETKDYTEVYRLISFFSLTPINFECEIQWDQFQPHACTISLFCMIFQETINLA